MLKLGTHRIGLPNIHRNRVARVEKKENSLLGVLIRFDAVKYN